MTGLLKELCTIHSPSGEEIHMRDFIIQYVVSEMKNWKCRPRLVYGDTFQDCLILEFGNPTVAAFAHMDTVGFTVRYQNQIVPIGSPDVYGGEILTGTDDLGLIECTLELDDEHHAFYKFGRGIATGTSLVYKNNFRETKSYITSPYLDNRVGIFNLLKVAETLENGLLIFSAWEEHGGGSVPYLVKYMYEKYNISKALVSDITWITEGVHFNKGAVVSFRDQRIPRKSFIQRTSDIARQSGIPWQIEVEAYGSSDGREIQASPYPVDWCFVGAPIEKPHSDHEKVHKNDLNSLVELYKVLMAHL